MGGEKNKKPQLLTISLLSSLFKQVIKFKEPLALLPGLWRATPSDPRTAIWAATLSKKNVLVSDSIYRKFLPFKLQIISWKHPKRNFLLELLACFSL